MQIKEGLFQNKYRIKSARYEGYDYSQAGYYFITICTHNQIKCLGKIRNNATAFSDIGRIAFGHWLDIPKKYPNIKLDFYVIMPNHVHGILIIKNDSNNNNVETRRGASVQQRYKNKFGSLQKNSISSVVNHFKGNVKRWCNKNGYENFQWQERFYDHIIRNEVALNKIRKYIQENPIKWYRDRNNSENI